MTTLLVRIAVAVAAAAVATPLALQATGQVGVDRTSRESSAAEEHDETGRDTRRRPHAPRPEPRGAVIGAEGEGRASASFGDDGIAFHMESDGSEGRGDAGASIDDDGMRLWMNSESTTGETGGTGVSVTDDGIRLWFGVEQDG